MSMMDWAERMGDVTILDEALLKLGVKSDAVKHLELSVVFIRNFTAGQCKGCESTWSMQWR